ncbi:IS3 family transposase [uncultured Draconibacterium sp.]|uniref:IS3 family transposase n=1 Tax=uncultured Draconibacterium sp. TaxID=1573823 RepID=UPI0032171551
MLTRTVDFSRQEGKETIVSACDLFGVSRQVYYRSIQSVKRKQSTAIQVVAMVHEIRNEMPRLGTRKLYYLLRDRLNEIGIGRDRLFSILRANHLLIKPARSYRKTTDSHHRFHKHKNLIAELVPSKPEQVWVADITYIGNRENQQYLALVTDAYSKKIVGHDVSVSLSADGAIRALKKGLKGRTYKTNTLIHHSDRGLQYCCDDYQKVLAERKVKCSMTESYDPYANAVAERINGILKQEFMLEDYRVKLPVMKELVKNSIEIYNTKRPHWSCEMLTPEQMHKQDAVKIKSYKKTPRFKASFETGCESINLV